MKAHSTTLAAFVLALFFILLHTCPGGAEAARLLRTKPSMSSVVSSSQPLKCIPADKKDPFKQLDSSFRKIPPSRSNPTQNKSKPP